MSITITGNELKKALDFSNPDGGKDADQLEHEIVISWMDERQSNEGETMPAGYYAYYAEYPEEGCVPLFDPK